MGTHHLETWRDNINEKFHAQLQTYCSVASVSRVTCLLLLLLWLLLLLLLLLTSIFVHIGVCVHTCIYLR